MKVTIDSTVGGAPITLEVAGVAEIRLALEAMRQKIEAAGEVDEREVQMAKKKTWFTDCAKKTQLNRRIREIKQRLQTALMMVDDAFTARFEPNEFVPQELMETTKPVWLEYASTLSSVHDNVEANLGITTWNSSAASTYKAALPTQKNALLELKKLAETQARAAEQVAMLNGAIFQAAVTTVESVTAKVEVGQPRKPKRSFFSSNLYGFYYYKRTDDAAAMCEGLARWMHEISVPSAEWGSSATALGDALAKVEASPKNLKPSGGWPESIASESPGAWVDDLGDHERQVSHREATEKGKGTKMR